MNLEHGIKLNQEQKLRFTQNMQQSVKVLQMPLSDLRQYIDNQYSENPVLEIKEPTSDFDSNLNTEEYYSKLAQDIYDNKYNEIRSGIYYEGDEDKSPLNLITSKKSLSDFLYDQLIELNLTDYERNLCDYIINSLSNTGYLEISIEEIACELNIDEEDIKDALEVVQNLEPYGIGARDIKECLKIQVKKLKLEDDIILEIIENYLEKIADNKYAMISKELKIPAKKVQEYGDIIKKLEPKPSRGFYTGEEVNYIIPDAEVRNINGEYFIIMNESNIPSIVINSTYNNILQSENDDDTKLYIKEKMKQAVFLIKAIEQRKSTLYKVLEYILVRQKEFFDNGKIYIKPLTLKEVAEEINMHESTVSRAIKDKYILTSFGTIKLKDLFVNKISSSKSSNDDVVSIKIKNRIKDIVNAEDKTKPLSDQKISSILEEENIRISRRTVTKYREELGIKGSAVRKRI